MHGTLRKYTLKRQANMNDIYARIIYADCKYDCEVWVGIAAIKCTDFCLDSLIEVLSDSNVRMIGGIFIDEQV